MYANSTMSTAKALRMNAIWEAAWMGTISSRRHCITQMPTTDGSYSKNSTSAPEVTQSTFAFHHVFSNLLLLSYMWDFQFPTWGPQVMVENLFNIFWSIDLTEFYFNWQLRWLSFVSVPPLAKWVVESLPQ